MFIELVDSLRCPRPHADTWLVLSARVIHDRDVLEGVLGCHICHAEYAVRGGVAHLEGDAAVELPQQAPGSVDQAMRLAAFLELTDAQGYALLCGEWGNHASALRLISPTHLLLANAPASVETGGGVSALVAAGPVPLAPGSARAAALDAVTGESPERVAAVMSAVRPGGRVVAPISVELPPGVREVARDAELWVGEREAEPTGFVPLSISRGR